MSEVNTPTIDIPKQSLQKGVVMVPTYYLTGKAAKDLDRLVKEGLAEYRAGHTIKAGSLKEAAQIYNRRYGKRRVQ